MSRSLHTQKLERRAARRLARPYGKRRDDGASLSGKSELNDPVSLQRLPIKIQKPLPGMRHSLQAQDIRTLIEILGPTARYGLKSIRLRPESAVRPEGVVFAEYLVPGEIHLYAVPELPWRLPYLLLPADIAVFERYGAQLEADYERTETGVAWSLEGLRRFTLYEVLAHELGHHLLQYHRGKRAVIFCRRSDHEKRADLQTRRVMRIMLGNGPDL